MNEEPKIDYNFLKNLEFKNRVADKFCLNVFHKYI